MSATTTDRNTLRKVGEIGEWPVAASTKIPAGVLTCRNTSGYAVNGSDSASLIFAGVSQAQADNSAGAAAAINVRVYRRGWYKFAKSGTITVANIGTAVTIYDNQTVALAATTTNDIVCGKIVAIDGDDLWIEIDAASS